MTKARDLANIISGGFTVDDLPTLTESQIPNLSASKITSGTFADARIAASNVSQHATSFDDNKIVNDISTLGLRVHTQENLNASNSNSASFDVFQDDSGIDNETNTDRNTNEFVSTGVFGAATSIDYNNPTQAGGATANYQFKTSNSQGYPTSFTDITSSSYQTIDFDYAIANGGYPIYTRTMGLTSYTTYDYKEIKDFSGNLEIGKAPTHGDLNQAKLQYSLDDSTYVDVDLSGASVVGSNPQRSNNAYSGGALSNFASDGTFNFSAASGAGSAVYNMGAKLQGIPTFKARYFRYYAMSKHSYTDTGYGIFTPYFLPLTFTATGSFTGNNITASASTSSMGAVITYQDNAGTNTLNTDIILQLSADGGSNFATATMTALPDFATGIKMAKVNDLSVTAGTSLKYKISFANQASGSKEARIRGVSLQY